MEEEGEEEQVPQQVADLADASVPNQLRGIRACKRCGILKTLDQFINDGCENCPFLDMVGSQMFPTNFAVNYSLAMLW
jgi:transcription elongation factor SPT4